MSSFDLRELALLPFLILLVVPMKGQQSNRPLHLILQSEFM
jgi:hypothetical protein